MEALRRHYAQFEPLRCTQIVQPPLPERTPKLGQYNTSNLLIYIWILLEYVLPKASLCLVASPLDVVR